MELFDLLESCVAESKKNKFTTNEAVKYLSKELKSINNDKFCLLLELSGYIPDLYSHDSSEETLYSKFVELLVCEWAQRIGFDESFLPTTKSGTEDIAIMPTPAILELLHSKPFDFDRSSHDGGKAFTFCPEASPACKGDCVCEGPVSIDQSNDGAISREEWLAFAGVCADDHTVWFKYISNQNIVTNRPYIYSFLAKLVPLSSWQCQLFNCTFFVKNG